MALSFFISLFVTYTDIANRQTTNIFFGFLGIHSSDAREKKKKKKKEKKKKREKKEKKEKNLIEKAKGVTLSWNLARNPEKNSSEIRRKNAKFDEENEKKSEISYPFAKKC